MNRPKVLVLDENSDLRLLVAKTLEKRVGCLVTEVDNVQDAIRLAESEHFELIVSGYGKSIRFGECLAKELLQTNNSTPLLFYSVKETTRFDIGGKNWSVVKIFNPQFDDLVQVICSAFGVEDKGGSARPRK